MGEKSLRERYIAGMVLAGVGDALGYKNGKWEFCFNGEAIHKELLEMGDLENVTVKLKKWMASDDTVMLLATAEALIESQDNPRKDVFNALARYYKECMKDMSGRAPGGSCIRGTSLLRPALRNGYKIPFHPRAGGCGAAMRSMCIGLRYPRPEELEELVAVSCEAGRMTHHVPVGYLGSLAGALFTSYCVQGRKPCSWGVGLLETLPLAWKYIETDGYALKENEETWDYFGIEWKKYLKMRGIEDGKSEPQFPEKYGFKERDAFVKKVSYSGWGGSSGHDAPMIAYDAFMGAGHDWKELCYRSMFHGGDSDSTGVMAAFWYGVTYGFDGVYDSNHKYIEYRDRLVNSGSALYDLAFSGEDSLQNTESLDGTQKDSQLSQDTEDATQKDS